MEFNDYQREATKTAIYPDMAVLLKNSSGYTYSKWTYPLLGLGSEIGELQNVCKKVVRDDGGKITLESLNKIKSEASDILWYLSEFLASLNLSFDEVAEYNLKKLKDRAERDVLKGSGDNR